MPSFRFRGFADASTVALSVAQGGRSAEANLVWAQALTAPSASFSIARVDGIGDNELVAPFPAWFAPTDITGFVGFDGQAISEPEGDTNVYDPTALEIFWSWDFGDPGYEPLITPNTALAHRDTNRAFVKRPAHVFASPGSRTVTCYAFDSAGNWATAQYVFGANGDSPEIADPDVFFAGREIYFSQEGIFPPDSLPTSRIISVSGVNTRIVSLAPNHDTSAAMIRLRLRRGETYVDLVEIGAYRHLYIDSYGDPADPPPKQVRINETRTGPFAVNNGDSKIAQGTPRIIDQDWEGRYDAATETGRRTGALLENGSRFGPSHLYHRCRVSGFSSFDQVKAPDVTRIMSDCDVTNWQDYGVYNGDGAGLKLAIIGCDLHQKDNALSGTSHGTGNSNFANLTNRHGPIRHANAREVYIACSSFFSRNGWSNAGSTAGTTNPPTVAQAAYRFGASDSLFIRNYTSVERSSFESGAGSFHFVDLGGKEPSRDYQSNVLFESNIFCGSGQTWTAMVDGHGRGMCARNNFWYVPAVQNTAGHKFEEVLRWTWYGPADGPAKTFAFNNTAVIMATEAQMNGSATRTFATINADHSPIIENNIYYLPNVGTPIGGSYEPLGNDPLAGFTPRFLGNRWNFPPIGHPSMGAEISCESVREGGAGPVGPGEWMAFDYPDYTAKCNGAGNALAPLTRAQVLANSGQYHQVSVHDYGRKAMAPGAAGGDGRVTFDFTPTKIRVQNNTDDTWTGNVWVLLDLRDYLMDFVPGTANPASIPAPVPGPGSAARGATEYGLWARTDFHGATRTQPRTQGAMEPAI